MASLESRLATLTESQKNLRSWLEDEAKDRRTDHDKLVRIEEQLKIGRKNWAMWAALIPGVAAILWKTIETIIFMMSRGGAP